MEVFSVLSAARVSPWSDSKKRFLAADVGGRQESVVSILQIENYTPSRHPNFCARIP
jgi:hypothetical protein